MKRYTRTEAEVINLNSRRRNPDSSIDHFHHHQVEPDWSFSQKLFRFLWGIIGVVILVGGLSVWANWGYIKNYYRILYAKLDSIDNRLQEMQQSPQIVMNDLRETNRRLAGSVALLDKTRMRLRDDDPSVQQLRRDLQDRDRKLAQRDQAVRISEQARKKAEENAAKIQAEKSNLERVVQQLQAVDDPVQREQLLHQKLASLSQRERLIVLIVEKISVRESTNRYRTTGPWIQLKDRNGRLRKGPFDPAVRVLKVAKNGKEFEYGYDRAYGFTQIMGENIGDWTLAALGRRYTVEEFLADPDAQRQTTYYRINKYLDLYHDRVDDVISAWHSGLPLKLAGNAKDILGTKTVDYVREVRSIDPLSGGWRTTTN